MALLRELSAPRAPECGQDFYLKDSTDLLSAKSTTTADLLSLFRTSNMQLCREAAEDYSIQNASSFLDLFPTTTASNNTAALPHYIPSPHDGVGSVLLPKELQASTNRPVNYCPVKLFVNRIPKWMDDAELRQIFTPFGHVLECYILPDTPGTTACAFVKYSSLRDAQKAIFYLHGKRSLNAKARPIQVKYADGELERLGYPPEIHPDGESVKVFVGCLPKSTSEKELFNLFSGFGRINEVHIVKDQNGRTKCSGFVTFARMSMALDSIKCLDRSYVPPGGKRPIEVRLAQSKHPSRSLQSQESHHFCRAVDSTSRNRKKLFEGGTKDRLVIAKPDVEITTTSDELLMSSNMHNTPDMSVAGQMTGLIEQLLSSGNLPPSPSNSLCDSDLLLPELAFAVTTSSHSNACHGLTVPSAPKSPRQAHAWLEYFAPDGQPFSFCGLDDAASNWQSPADCDTPDFPLPSLASTPAEADTKGHSGISGARLHSYSTDALYYDRKAMLLPDLSLLDLLYPRDAHNQRQ